MSLSPELPREKLPVHHQPSLFFSSTPRRVRQTEPQPCSSGADGSSITAATSPAESAAPAVSFGGGDVGCSGEASDVTASSTARQEPPAACAEAGATVGQDEPPVGWVIDVRPTPRSDIPLLPRRKKKRRKKAGGGLSAAGLSAAPTGHDDTVSSAAPARDEGPPPDRSAVLEPGMPTDRGGGRSAQATSAGEEAAAEAQGAGVSDAATPRRHPASCLHTGRRSVGGGDDEEGKCAMNAPGLSKDMAGRPKKATSKPRPSFTNSRKPGNSGPPGTAADAGAVFAASPATAEASRGTLGRRMNTSRVPRKRTHAGGGSESESRGELGMALHTPQLTSAGNSKRSASAAEREQPKGTDKTTTNGGGGRAGTKRSSSGEGQEDEYKRVKKQKRKKKRGGGSFSAGKRDDIDDIFGSLT